MHTYLLHKVFDLGADAQTNQLVGSNQRGGCHHWGILSNERRCPSWLSRPGTGSLLHLPLTEVLLQEAPLVLWDHFKVDAHAKALVHQTIELGVTLVTSQETTRADGFLDRNRDSPIRQRLQQLDLLHNLGLHGGWGCVGRGWGLVTISARLRTWYYLRSSLDWWRHTNWNVCWSLPCKLDAWCLLRGQLANFCRGDYTATTNWWTAWWLLFVKGIGADGRLARLRKVQGTNIGFISQLKAALDDTSAWIGGLWRLCTLLIRSSN